LFVGEREVLMGLTQRMFKVSTTTNEKTPLRRTRGVMGLDPLGGFGGKLSALRLGEPGVLPLLVDFPQESAIKCRVRKLSAPNSVPVRTFDIPASAVVRNRARHSDP
jgi:hypothetical protein